MTGKRLAMAWLRKEDWPRWLAIDPIFHPEYDHWLRHTEELTTTLKKTGVVVEKIIVDPDEFLAWTRTAHDGEVDSKARAGFAAYHLLRRTGTKRLAR